MRKNPTGLSLLFLRNRRSFCTTSNRYGDSVADPVFPPVGMEAMIFDVPAPREGRGRPQSKSAGDDDVTPLEIERLEPPFRESLNEGRWAPAPDPRLSTRFTGQAYPTDGSGARSRLTLGGSSQDGAHLDRRIARACGMVTRR
jgi:hypothetical protein